MSAEHPRERMIQTALVLMGEQGVDATSFSQIIERSGAPRGSIYHHFPGGKAQLIEEATRYAGDLVVRMFNETVADKADPLAAIDAITAFWRGMLWNSDFAAGCPVLAATLDSSHSAAAHDAARDAFERWEDLYADVLQRAGVPEERARSLGSTAISAVEGAVILSRAQRSNAPLDRVADELRRLFHQAIEDARASSTGGTK